MVNTTFTNYIDQFILTEELDFPIVINKTNSEFILPVFLNKIKFDDSFLTTPQYKDEKEIFDLKERHDIDELELETSYKKFMY